MLRQLSRHLRYGGFPYRRYMRRHDCVFIHVPKAAGTSVLRALGGDRKQIRDHMCWRAFRNADPVRWERSYKFAFVRNPWDRVASVYKYLRRGGNGNERLQTVRRIETDGVSFGQFVTEVLQPDRISLHPLFLPQSHFICDMDGTVRVDFVGRLERIDDDFATIAKRLALKTQQLEMVNQSQKAGGYRELYDDALIDRVAQLYAADIAIFGYEF